MLKIINMLTRFNHDVRSNRKIKYIVVHWVGAKSSAIDNARYFQGGDRQSSAHYFVDDNNIIKSVLEKNVAWAVGSNSLLDTGSPYAKYGAKYFKKCTNENSISIEMCCSRNSKGELYITDNTIENTAKLVQAIQKRLNISDSHVIRHFDVNGKICPNGYIKPKKWRKLHAILTGNYFKIKTKGKLITRSGSSLKTNKVRTLEKGRIYDIVQVKGNRGQLINGDWITITDKYVDSITK